MNPDPKIVIALDYAQPQDALTFTKRLDPTLCRLKVGKELFTTGGPQLVDALIAKDFDVFLDLKFYRRLTLLRPHFPLPLFSIDKQS